MSVSELRFGFGANWQSYIDRALTPRRIAAAARSLQELLGLEHLRGRIFLDVGCGSGLFSLAACLLGAAEVRSFDYDRQSVAACEALRARAGIGPARWSVFQGSILDAVLIERQAPADIVYSWGVLHHTGAMWAAIDNTVRLVRPGGALALAIYNQQDRLIGGSAMWWQIKRAYNLSPRPVRYALERAYALADAAVDLVQTGDPLRTLRSYRESARGMDYWHDVRDWLGGFPYEYASTAAMVRYLEDRHGLATVCVRACHGYGCNEYVFRRPAQ